MLLMIDNYDSFTYNLVQYFGELGVECRVVRNDQISVDDIDRLRPEYLVISPGPRTPREAGVSVEAIQDFAGRIPILGVCLGHQCIASAYGGNIKHARDIMHGKPSLIWHDGRGVFDKLARPLEAARYHSLIVNEAALPACLEVSARTRLDDGTADEIMAIRHRELPVVGLQFHPESILTRDGHAILRNFLALKNRGVRKCA